MRNKRKETYSFMMQRGPREVKLPAIVVAELEYGAEHGDQYDRNRRVLDAFLDAFEVVPFDAACARAYGKLRAHLSSQGLTIGPNDMLIAATALAHNAILVTNNVKEFKRVPYLQIESWYEISEEER